MIRFRYPRGWLTAWQLKGGPTICRVLGEITGWWTDCRLPGLKHLFFPTTHRMAAVDTALTAADTALTWRQLSCTNSFSSPTVAHPLMMSGGSTIKLVGKGSAARPRCFFVIQHKLFDPRYKWHVRRRLESFGLGLFTVTVCWKLCMDVWVDTLCAAKTDFLKQYITTDSFDQSWTIEVN